MTEDTVILCGLTYGQIAEVAKQAPNMRFAAKRLGVNYDYFINVMAVHSMRDMFNSRKVRKRCVSREEIVQVASEGYTRKDAAYLLGISPSYLKDLIKLWDLADSFIIRKGTAAWVTRVGYCSNDTIRWRKHYAHNKDERNRQRREKYHANKMKSGGSRENMFRLPEEAHPKEQHL